jgi:alcohol dehydrogenase
MPTTLPAACDGPLAFTGVKLKRGKRKRSIRRASRKPRRLRHYLGFLTPSASAALKALLERDRQQRARRLATTAADQARQRVRPTRPKMRALQAAAGGKVRWREVAAPALQGSDGAIVHPIASATCDLDGAIVLGASSFALPLHLGHECVAEVLEVGENVKSVKPGDLVVVPFEINCGTCTACREGRTGSCTGVPPGSCYGMGLATGHWGGAFSDKLAVPYADAMLVPLPDGIDPVAAASVADNICDAYRHFGPHLPSLLARDPDARILVLGPRRRSLLSPSVPLYAALIARALGARHVDFADYRPSVREHAERLGFNALHPRDLRGEPLAALVADVSATDLGFALSRTAPDGICSSSGSFQHSTRVPALQMYVRNVTLHFGRVHARAVMPEALKLIASGHLDPLLLDTSRGPLEEAPRLIGRHAREGAVKTILTDC